MVHTIDSAISIVKEYISGWFFNPFDENGICSRNWREVVGTCCDSKVVSCFSADDRIVCFQFREMTRRSDNYTIGLPKKSADVGDIIIEISIAPYQTWKSFNLSKREDITELGEMIDYMEKR